MTDREIAENVQVLFDKGYTHDYGDTDYFYDASEETLDRAYELLDELKANGSVAFAKKYLS